MDDISDELKSALEEIRKNLKITREMISEARIRAIVHEELEAYAKRQVQARRYGLPSQAEVK